jgi:6-phosphofructokinase 1
MRIGILTGGGDCPGLNAAIRAVVKHAIIEYEDEVIGFMSGWRGVRDCEYTFLTRDDVRSLLNLGGTILGTDRFHPDQEEGATEKVVNTIVDLGIEAIVCIGGDGTTYAASEVSKALEKETGKGIQIVSIPKTIDNDVYGTERCIGYETALNIATEAIDRLHTTAESHHRIMVVEVMGREAGWIAVGSGLAGGAEVILTPEEPFDIQKVCDYLIDRHNRYAKFSIVVVAEGAVPKKGTDMDFDLQLDSVGAIVAGSIGTAVADEIHKRTKIDTRLTVLGHVQRGGRPTPQDRNLASRFGIAAVDALHAGETGILTVINSDFVDTIPYEETAGKTKTVPEEYLRVARSI